jgi:Protein of unknown function (DUF4058)
MTNPFPGMNPYLEQPEFWSDFHAQLVAASARVLAPQLLPKYRIVTDKWTYKIANTVRQSYLEVRDAATREVITAIEVLSPANKRSDGRRKYEAKRQDILESLTHLVEIDLLRDGEPLPMEANALETHYRILVSRSDTRPTADLYAFNLYERIPNIPIPLRPDDTEPVLDIQQILNDLYEQLGYAYFIDYTQAPPLPWSMADVQSWVSA